MLGKDFDMKNLGAYKKILGMETHKDIRARKLWLSKESYVEKTLDRFGMNNSKVVNTSLVNHFKLSLNQYPKIDGEVEYMSNVLYASVVGFLKYDMFNTIIDLAQAISQVCKFMSNP